MSFFSKHYMTFYIVFLANMHIISQWRLRHKDAKITCCVFMLKKKKKKRQYVGSMLVTFLNFTMSFSWTILNPDNLLHSIHSFPTVSFNYVTCFNLSILYIGIGPLLNTGLYSLCKIVSFEKQAPFQFRFVLMEMCVLLNVYKFDNIILLLIWQIKLCCLAAKESLQRCERTYAEWDHLFVPCHTAFMETWKEETARPYSFPWSFRNHYEPRQRDFLSDPLKTLAKTLLAQRDGQLKRVHSTFQKVIWKLSIKAAVNRDTGCSVAGPYIASTCVWFKGKTTGICMCLDRISVLG